MPNPVVTSDWQYSDFASKPTVEERLATATLHDAEVRKAAVDDGGGQGRYTRLSQGYLETLAKLIKEYRDEIRLEAMKASQAADRSTPVNLRPRF